MDLVVGCAAADESAPLCLAGAAIWVADVGRSIGFYSHVLGFSVVVLEVGADLAIVDGRGFSLLLAGPNAQTPQARLRAGASFARPGTTVFFFGREAVDLDVLRDDIGSCGVEARIVAHSWGSSSLVTTDPDGYTVSFWTPTTLEPAAILDRYAAGGDELAAALEGLAEESFDWRLDSARRDLWSIRQIVHHLADTEASALGQTKAGIAEPGRIWLANGFNQETWAEALDYAGRPIEPAVALFSAVRGHLSDLLRHVPDAWDRSTQSEDGREVTAGTMIGMLTHCEHFEDIHAIRERHGV